MQITPPFKTLPRAFLFDHDGVLVASEPLHFMAWQRLFAELNIPFSESEIRLTVGKTAPQILTHVLGIHRPEWDGSDLQDLVNRKSQYYLEAALKDLEPYPGVREGLKWLKSIGAKTAVVSNARKKELTEALVRLKLLPLFDTVVSREDVPTPKPDPFPYQMAAATLETPEQDCLAIEDAPPGIEAALRARIPSVAVLTNFDERAMSQPVPGRADLKPIWIVKSMQDFFSGLQSISR